MHRLVALSILLSLWPVTASPREPRIVEAGGFDVVGIAVRTNNRAEMGTQGKIPGLWQQFYSKHLADEIPMRADRDTLALYYDYVSDKDGDYTYMIGARVKTTNDLTTLPAGFTMKRVPKARYAVFTSGQGPLAAIVIDTWRKIWNIEKGKPGSDRAYNVDYDLYDQRSSTPNSAEMDVYVGIK